MKPLMPWCLALCLPAAAPAQQAATWRGQTARHWADRLADQHARVRWYAGYALGQIGPEAAVAIPPLTEILRNRSEHEYVRGVAAWGLGRIASDDKPVVDLLVETLRSNHVSVRRNSARALGNLGPAACPSQRHRPRPWDAKAIPALVELLGDEDTAVRVGAAVALWKIDRHPKAIPALVQIARLGQGGDPYQAVVALGQIASQTEAARAALVTALRHTDPDVRRASARALGQVGPPAIPALKQTMVDPDNEVRRGAVEALGWIGPAALPELIDALKDQNPAVRRAAARALGRLGPAAQAAEPALIEALDDTNQQVRRSAAWALDRIKKQSAHL